jgi:hemolysin III
MSISVDQQLRPLPLLEPPKPRLRGVSHQIAFFAAIAAGTWLVATAGSARAIAATSIYALTLALMLGVSATYHRGNRPPAAGRRWKRADHAMIFLFVAGTYTPSCVLAIGGAPGMRLLTLVWVGAALGSLRALLWVRAPRVVATAFYVALGWLMVAFWSDVRGALGAIPLALILVGGLLYTLGAVVYALRRPDPSPRWFGYHEVFHSFVIAACVCHFVVITHIVQIQP